MNSDTRSAKQIMVSPENALIGRETAIAPPALHYVYQTPITEELSGDQQKIIFGMGCFWGAERLFWSLEGVLSTSVGYSGGFTKNPTYDEVCSAQTGHTEVVSVIYDPSIISLNTLLNEFWERHDPTQGMQQGNDTGTQYRSAIYITSEAQESIVLASRQQYQSLLNNENKGQITTEILPAGRYYYAEEYHQQYLAKNPNGYCGLGGTGVCFVK
ncbi:peptide-methionine (S)-S-oxide reductase MsrA [Vibrio sp. 10N.261.55.A7]|uniref:peptide-methionine (S)-S-oxide reductase MsrA n=1 Tax=Vibrio sp. 10N.261.55.A7 TaxID=1880851 RepID=UPI000C85A0BD|nr:peptide-methionine (S)-S-oxide reductase MsrA [Vibrio sp. 10N.261.55.A7]PMJ99699.1 peptide-methionine (S)-S-oxide reductase [Vibrio sp. 10N.261.55.A7]